MHLTLPPLFEHQKDAVAGALAELRVADRIKVLMACATGKTRVGPEIAIARGARTVIVYLPSLALMRQTLQTWIDSPFVGGMSYLCVCSDSTVASGADEPIVTTEDLIAEFHLAKKTVTTHSADVHEFLTLPGFDGVRIIFATYQSCDVVRDGCPEGFKFDLGIFDEAHRTAGKDSAFSAPLLDSHTQIAKRVFMTATPKHLNIKKRNKNLEAVVAFSMDDELVYGRTAYKLPIRQAINKGIIADYKVLISVIDDKMIASDWNEGNVQGINAESIAHALAIRKAMDEYGIKKVVTFHDSIEDARLFAENATIQGELGAQTFHVSGSIPVGVRSGIMENFACAPKGLVTNARCLTEGVDAPEIDMVAFLHPKKSKIDIIQTIGRALRKPYGIAKTAYILLPLYVSQIETGGYDRALKDTGLETVNEVLKSLREQDEVVDIAIRDAVMERVNRQPVNLDFIKISGPSIRIDLLREAITTQCLDTLGEFWDEIFARLKQFVEEHGHARVPQHYKTAEGYVLGAWVGTQRRTKDTLSSERKARLEVLTGWSWDVFSDQWEAGFHHAMGYAAREGHARVPATYKTADGYTLGSWVFTQRATKDTLSPERKARLEALPRWSWDVFSDQWEEGFKNAQEYAAREGHARVPLRYKTAEGYALGAWVRGQREKKDFMSLERKTRLEALQGWSWDVISAQWEEGFRHAQEYAAHEGHARVPATYKTAEGYALGAWVGTQRRTKDTFASERKARLEALPGWVWRFTSK